MTKSKNNGNVLIVVLVYFMLMTSAITLVYANAKAANRAVNSNQMAIESRLELVYLANAIKKSWYENEPTSMNLCYNQSEITITPKSLEIVNLWQMTVKVTKKEGSYGLILIYNPKNHWFESFEFID